MLERKTLMTMMVFTALAMTSHLCADIQLPALFGDHMVLQQGRAVPVWGRAEPGETVAVEFADQKESVTAGDDGEWMVKLKPLKASKAPGKLVVSGKNKIEVSDVLVGEVWVASGQSNMWWPVRRSKDGSKAINEADKIPTLRLFNIPGTASHKPENDVKAKWEVSSPKSVADFSAVAYFFGKELAERLDVPVGLIHGSVRGSVIEAWMSKETLETVKSSTPVVDAWANTEKWDLDAYPDPKNHLREYWDQAAKGLKAYMDEWTKLKEKGVKDPRKEMSAATLKALKQNQKVHISCKKGDPPSSFHNGMIHPLAPFAIQGVIWYQGETNALRDDITKDRYKKLLTAMIQDWRGMWKQGDFTFLLVGLANFQTKKKHLKNGWPLVRQAQFEASKDIPNVDFANIIDIGEAKNVHPKNKQEVARRLSLIALNDVYGKSTVSSGPVKANVKKTDSGFNVKFDHAASGLKTYGDGPVKGFKVAGEDKQWYPAQATIEGNSIVVSSDSVKAPIALRYAWEDNPEDANLRNAEGLPAVPFRTDEWPRVDD